ncbi:MAG: hypothetical protein VKM98_08640 [Cyanobacteriota bacterium]|nr:hypothetical protein [Cyanobacteriota bacterium]
MSAFGQTQAASPAARTLSFVIGSPNRASADTRQDQFNRRFVSRLERSNSADLIALARRVYSQFLCTGGSSQSSPKGVVLQGRWGRVVFDWPTLLPDELFVPGDWLIGQGAGTSRAGRSRSRPQPPCPTPMS